MDYKENPDMQFTQWESMSQMVSSRKIKLVKAGNNCMKVEPASSYIFIIFPFIMLIFLFVVLTVTDSVSAFGIKNFIGFAVFIVILGFGISFVQKFGFKPAIFDFDKRIYSFNDNQELSFDEIKGIQILTYHHDMPGNYKIRFEINLVKLSGERVHLYNNSKYELIVKQAETLAEKIGVELWDAT